METGRVFSCDSCNKTIELFPAELTAPEEWFTLTYWKGIGATNHYNFCSLDCLTKWLDKRHLPIPDVYLKSFDK